LSDFIDNKSPSKRNVLRGRGRENKREKIRRKEKA